MLVKINNKIFCKTQKNNFGGLKNFLYVCKLGVRLENNFRVMYERVSSGVS
jgi:hypothetical protein